MTPVPSTRREWLARVRWALAAAPLSAALTALRAQAAAKTQKADVSYQYTPKGDQHCGACASFIAGAAPGPGACRIVDGPIQPDGWCVLFARR